MKRSHGPRLGENGGMVRITVGMVDIMAVIGGDAVGATFGRDSSVASLVERFLVLHAVRRYMFSHLQLL